MKKILENNFTITIIGTMLGVFAAFFLNDWREKQTSSILINEILEKIVIEIDSNQKIVEENLVELEKFLEAYTIISSKGDNIIMSVDEMKLFKSKFPDVLFASDSTQINDSTYSYNDVVVNLNVPTINQLSDFAWKASKTRDIYVQVSFDCLYWLESTYGLQNRLKQEYEEIFQIMSGSLKGDINRKVKLSITYEKLLIEQYKQIDYIIKSCRL